MGLTLLRANTYIYSLWPWAPKHPRYQPCRTQRYATKLQRKSRQGSPTRYSTSGDEWLALAGNGVRLGLIFFSIFGLACYQILKYYIRNREDRTSMKVLIGILWTAEAIHVVATPMNYDRVGKMLDDPDLFSRLKWSIAIMLLAGSLRTIILQGIVCRRIWKLGYQNWLFIAILIIVSTGSVLIHPHLPDITLSGVLCFLLTRQRTNKLRLERVNSIPSAFTYAASIGALAPLCLFVSIILV
ncbi:hypothetical protein C8T65DRAFT_117072 [Cerioporus squamosus]|nr:hypothetical protein C8T65DRAFT_117072 [Cerioporus squamosus]